MCTQPTQPASPEGPTPDLLTTLEAAAMLRLSPRTLERYRVTGEGPPFIKLGGRVFYRRSDLIAWCAARQRRSTSDPGPSPTPPTRSSKSAPKRRDARSTERGAGVSPPSP